MDDISIKIGTRVKQIRQSKGISQEELADTAYLNRSFVGLIERGKKNATVKTIEKICIALGITLQEFFSFDLNEFDLQTESQRRATVLLKQIDDKDAAQVIDIMKRIIEFKTS